MEIDKKEGHLRVANLYFTVGIPFADASEMLTDEGVSFTTDDMGNGWVWARVVNLKDKQHVFNLSLGFFNDLFSTFEFTVGTDNLPIGDWTDISVAGETSRKVTLENILTATIGTQRRFQWGEIWCEIEPRNQAASAGARYQGVL